uniref:Uncharacterized protein n=1 Tax=Manihot esculenta TaxID=3983 RepID=A0A2C9UN80_MANES
MREFLGSDLTFIKRNGENCFAAPLNPQNDIAYTIFISTETSPSSPPVVPKKARDPAASSPRHSLSRHRLVRGTISTIQGRPKENPHHQLSYFENHNAHLRPVFRFIPRQQKFSIEVASSRNQRSTGSFLALHRSQPNPHSPRPSCSFCSALKF